MEYLEKVSQGSDKVIEHLKIEMQNIRTGRAHVGLVSEIMVDVYGAKTPLKQIANITVVDARSIQIQPWDKGNNNQIEVALREGEASLSVVNAGDLIHVNIPDLTEERRLEYKKLAKEKAEEARVAIRNVRQQIWEETKRAKADGVISEDEMYYRESEIQKAVNEKNKEIETILASKEKELMEV